MATGQTELETYLQLVLQASSDGLLVLGADLTVRWASGSVERVSGWTLEDLASSDPLRLVHPDHVELAMTNLARLLAGEDPDELRTVCQLLHRDGRWIWAELTGRDLRGVGAVDGVVISVRDVSQRVADEEALRRSERRLQSLVENSNDCLLVIEEDLSISYASEAMFRIIGFRPEVAMASVLGDGMPEPDRSRLLHAYREVIDDPSLVRRIEVRCNHADGRELWLETVLSNHLDDVDIRGIVSNFRDVTEQRRASDELRERTEQVELAKRDNGLLLEIFDLTDDVAVLLDEDGRVMYLNAAARDFYGIDDVAAAGLVGTDWHPAGGTLDQVIEMIQQSDGAFVRWSGEVSAERPDGRSVPMLVQILAHRDHVGGRARFYSAVGRDISERKELELSLEEQATHDPLTGLPNRVLLFERITRALEGLRSVAGHHSVALLFIDIDHFKSINDTLGHARGDQILRVVAERISSVVRPGDTVARFGGDEFVVLCERLDQPEDAVVIAHRVEAALRSPWEIDEREIQLGVSIGISYAEESDSDPSAVLRDADTAMYRAKSDGRGRWVIFDDDLRAQATERQRIETSLRTTSHGEELELFYQPVVDLADGRITGVETLLRWRHDGQLIQPADFVPVAEQTGLIVPVGAWVLETACEQLAEWQVLPDWRHLRLAVNVSARQLQHPSFAGVVAGVTGSSRITPDTLSLEITESVLLDDVTAARARLERLKLLGVRISLDDFGTGYSSLTYLRRFPVDAVKLDRSFVEGIGVDDGDTAIVTAVVNLAKALGKESIAEGIETEAQLRALVELGCDAGQGYYFSRPVPAEEMTALLRDGGAWPGISTAGPGDRAHRADPRTT